jgi:CHAD domain-containing protein
MSDGIQYLLPAGTRPAAAVELLAARLGVVVDAAAATERTFYDTFDGRLHADGLVLLHEDGRLKLADAVAYGERAGAPYERPPARLLVAELAPGPLSEALAPIVEMRALLPTATVRSRARGMRVLDGEEKTVVRLALETAALATDGRPHTRLRPRLRVVGVRGYDAPLQRVGRTLEQDLGLVVAGEALHEEAVAAAGGRPEGVASKLDFALAPDERAETAAATVLAHLLATIELNLPGTLADVDTEFLHDLRVAVRRTRSVQRQLAGVFPAAALERHRRAFRWLQQVTGATRDLDVNLLDFDHLASMLPGSVAPDLEPLRGVLAAHRRDELDQMLRALRSARAKRALAGWSALVGGLADAPAARRPDAGRPIAEVAGERIFRVHRRMVKMGRAIEDDGPHEALHELRKKGKELRYLLELFGSVYPPEVTKPMVKTLKKLQDVLGRFQDREVQAELVRSLRDDVAATDGGAAALMAMGQLVDELERDQMAARAEFDERFDVFAAKPQRRLVRETFA